METAVFVIIFSVIILAAAILFVYVIVSNRNKATQLYKAAANQESRGNYLEAIALYEAYLKENDDETQQVGHKIKTIRSLITNQALLFKQQKL